MKIMRWTWVGVGFGVGYVLGARAGRERYEQIVGLTGRTASDFGLVPAVQNVVEETKSTVGDVHDAVAERSSDALQTGADQVNRAVGSAGDAVTQRISDHPN
jgi:hypothetical protein